MTQIAVAKARKTRATRLKTAPKRAKRSKSTQSTSYALGLVVWATFSLVAFGATAYAEMDAPLVYVSATSTDIVNTIVNKVPEFVSPVLEDVKKPETPEEVKAYVIAEAKKAGVHVAKIDHIVTNESQYNPNAVGDMNITCKRTGKPVRARGIWQITECYYPQVSDACAFDVKCSTEIALNIIASSKKACISQWSTCRAWYNK